MSAYFTASYQIDDPDMYQQYIAGVMPTLANYKVKPLVAGHEHKAVEGTPNPVVVILEFESMDEAESWYNSDEYQKVLPLRLNSTSKGWATLSKQFVMPGA